MESEISSTTEEVKHVQDPEEKLQNIGEADTDLQASECRSFDVDDILDLAGGAKDAIARHRASSPETETREAGETTGTKQCNASSVLCDLVYWRDLQKTGVVFGVSLLLLLSLTVCSIVSVLAYISLALLSVTVSFRIYKGIVQAVQKSEDGHPFKTYLGQDISISADLVHKYSEQALVSFNAGLKELRRLFLVEDLVDSLKFAVLMWILTYVGALFNGLTLIIFAHVAVFTWPVIYEKHQVQIDHYYGLVNNQIKDVVKKIQAKIPGAKPKAE